jgi:ferrochelatase
VLVNWIILPRRPPESAKAYKEIWTENGSPLIHYCTELVNGLNATLGDPVEIGMAYGNPSFKAGIGKLLDAGVDEICLLPMFPHYAMATTGSCVAGVKGELKRRKSKATLRVVPPFYIEPTFIKPLADSLADVDEYILFSYHGLPERHLKKTDPTGHHCLSSAECCSEPSVAHDTCYRFQCLSTTRAVVAEANIPAEQYSISFQSRLGRTKWLEPYTDEVLKQLPAEGKKRLAVICPAFFCDCLETLEEIEIRGREIFLASGGESFRMIPCLNATASAFHCLETLMADAENWSMA